MSSQTDKAEVQPFHLIDVEQQQVAADPQTKSVNLGPPVSCCRLQPSSPFIIQHKNSNILPSNGSHVMKFHCDSLQFETSVDNCYLEYTQSKQLFIVVLKVVQCLDPAPTLIGKYFTSLWAEIFFTFYRFLNQNVVFRTNIFNSKQ